MVTFWTLPSLLLLLLLLLLGLLLLLLLGLMSPLGLTNPTRLSMDMIMNIA